MIYIHYYETGNIFTDTVNEKTQSNIIKFISYLISDAKEYLPFELTDDVSEKIYQIIKMREFYNVAKKKEMEKNDVANINKIKNFKPDKIHHNIKKRWTHVILLSTLDHLSNQEKGELDDLY
jgi:hypothetical protein